MRGRFQRVRARIPLVRGDFRGCDGDSCRWWPGGGAWTHVIPFFAFPPDVCRGSTRPARSSVHAQLRKIIKTRGHFPNDDAATKLIWLALRNITAKWERTSYYWRAAMNQFAILYDGRFDPSTA